jgi:cell division protein FtsB
MKSFLPDASWLNKYSLAVIAFLLWIALLDGKYSWVKQYKLRKQINQIEQDKEEYLSKLAQTKEEYQNLINNKERYAREKYFISRPNEDVFIVE